MTIRFAIRALAVLGAVTTLAACASYPDAPRYSIYANPPAAGSAEAGASQPRPTEAATEAPPPATAPYESIEGGALPPPVSTQPPTESYNSPPVDRDAPPPAGSAAAMAASTGAVAAPAAGAMGYVIQQGDTISGVGRRFGTPVQILIDLNDLGPRAAIAPGQRIILPESAVDRGVDPFATGPSPTGVIASNEGLPPPPPPPPPSGNQALPPRPGAFQGLPWGATELQMAQRFGAALKPAECPPLSLIRLK